MYQTNEEVFRVQNSTAINRWVVDSLNGVYSVSDHRLIWMRLAGAPGKQRGTGMT